MKARTALAFFIIIIFSLPIHAQKLIPVDSIVIPRPTYVSKDQNGNIYLADVKGKIFQYTHDLSSALVYSPDRPARITSMETWQGLRVFCFFKDIQEYTLLNRFLDGPHRYDLNDPEIIFVNAATLAYDNNLWLFDQSGLKLIKYNTTRRAIEFTKPVDLILQSPLENIVAFREYQNLVYLIDSKAGMYIFDNLGNYKLRVDFPEVRWIGFYENYMYYYLNGEIVLQHLYDQTVKKIQLQIKSPDFFVKSESGWYVFKNERLYRCIEN